MNTDTIPENTGSISKFTRLSGLLLLVFSLIVIFVRFVQFALFNDPPLDELVQTQGFILLLGIPSVLSAIFFLVGLAGLYIKHIQRLGVFGNWVFLAAYLGIQLSAGAIWSYAFVAPAIAPIAPELLASPSSGVVRWTLISFLLGQVGWLLAGLWTFWVAVLPRWSSLTLVLSIAAGIALAPFADTQLLRLLFNILLGIGPGAIGVALWRGDQRSP